MVVLKVRLMENSRGNLGPALKIELHIRRGKKD
jgi:hypothetical protein